MVKKPQKTAAQPEPTPPAAPKMRASNVVVACPACGAPHYIQVEGELDGDLLTAIPQKKSIMMVARSPEAGGDYAVLSFEIGVYSESDALRIVNEAIGLSPDLGTPAPLESAPPVPGPEEPPVRAPEPDLRPESDQHPTV